MMKKTSLDAVGGGCGPQKPSSLAVYGESVGAPACFDHERRKWNNRLRCAQ